MHSLQAPCLAGSRPQRQWAHSRQRRRQGAQAAAAGAEPCEKCGQPADKIPWGCDRKGKIPGGVGSLPGFDKWWPIKAYRPCPALAQRGMTYTRTGQITDEVLFGGRRPTQGRKPQPEPPAQQAQAEAPRPEASVKQAQAQEAGQAPFEKE